MQDFKHILVATDFSAHAEHAADVAIMLADRFKAKVTLVHAYSVPVTAYSEGIAWPIEDFEREARRALDAAASKLKERFPRLETQLRLGPAGEQIVTAVEELGADLVVMGTHGRRGLSRAILGSVAERVVRTAAVPVMTVPLPRAAKASA